jgi:hypothetical protein
MDAESINVLKESLRLNNELKQRFERLGEFADRVQHLRTAKLINNGQIVALKEQIARLEKEARKPPRKPKQAPQNEWHHLAKLLQSADTTRKVSLVGKSRPEVLAQLEARLGKEPAEVLAKRVRVYKKLSKGPHTSVVVFTKGAQTPNSVKRLLEERQITQEAYVLHQKQLLKIQK